MATTKQAAKGGSSGSLEQKKAAGTPQQEGKEKEPAKAATKEEKTTPKAGSKDTPKDSKDSAKKPVRDDKKEAGQGGSGGGQERSRGGRPEDHRGRDRGRRSSRDRPDHRGRDKEDREVCRNFLHNRCDRGSLCKYYHPRSSSRPRPGPDEQEHRRGSPTRGPGAGSNQIICRDFIRNMCTRGTECRFFHPPTDSSGKKRQGSWLTFCHDFRNGHCLRSDCRFFHITRDDEESYRATGEIPLHIVDQAVRKAMVLDAALTGTRPTCKEFLRGLCNMQNCRFRHLNQREYEDEVFHALQEEFENLLGPPDRRPASPPINNPYPASLGAFHEAPGKYVASPGGFREEMMPPEEMRGPMLPPSEYESEPKRPRYFSGERIFPPEEYRDGGEAPRKWEERMDYEQVEHGDGNPRDAYRFMQEVYALRNENTEIRRNAEREITELKEEVRRVMEENAGMRHEVAKVRAQAAEETLANKAALDKLTLANNTLLEDLRKAEEGARRLEIESREKLKAMDNKQKTTSVELERKMDMLQKDGAQLRDALAKANAAQKKSEDEKAKLLAELDDMRAKMRSSAPPPPSLRKDHHHHHSQQQQVQQQQHSSSGGYTTKSTYPRDMMEEGGGSGGYNEMLHGDRRGGDGRDQDMRGLAMRGQGRYSPDAWGNADKNGRAQYGSGSSPGYGMRGGASDGDRSRGWHSSAPSQDVWGAKNSGGSLMGEYQGDERIRGPTQGTSLLHGGSYTSTGSNSGAGLLNLPMDVGDYSKAPPRAPQANQMGLEGQYAGGQSMMHFEERDYSLSGYDADGRAGQYGNSSSSSSHQQRATAGWQQGGSDGGRGRGMGQGWRRGKPF